MRWTANHEVTRITNPITIDHTLLRHHLLPGILRLLSKNKHNELPHSVYELGTVVRDHKTRTGLLSLLLKNPVDSLFVGEFKQLCRI